MKQPEDNNPRPSPLKTRAAARKPYKKPSVRHEQVFETAALKCEKVTSGGTCGTLIKVS